MKGNHSKPKTPGFRKKAGASVPSADGQIAIVPGYRLSVPETGSLGGSKGPGCAEMVAVDPEALISLGVESLCRLPSDPARLTRFLTRDDRADGRTDSDAFARGIRRYCRFDVGIKSGCPAAAGMKVKEWLNANFAGGYLAYRRYRIAAEIQAGLIGHGLPLLRNESQARALAPHRNDTQFWDKLSEVRGPDGFPIAKHLAEAFGKKLDKPEAGKAPAASEAALLEGLERLQAAAMGVPSKKDGVLSVLLWHIDRAIDLLSPPGTDVGRTPTIPPESAPASGSDTEAQMELP